MTNDDGKSKEKEIKDFNSTSDFKEYFEARELENISKTDLKKICLIIATLKARNVNLKLDYFFEMAFYELNAKKSEDRFWISLAVTFALAVSSLIVTIVKD